MNKKLFVLFLIPFLFAGVVDAKKSKKSRKKAKSQKAMVKAVEGDYGVGGQLGTLTGVTGQYFMSNTIALASTLGVSLGGGSGIGLSFDGQYFFKDSLKIDVSEGAFYFYTGLGAKYIFSPGTFYVRVPLGGSYFFAKERVGAYLELVPGYQANNGSGVYFELALGGRWFFD